MTTTFRNPILGLVRETLAASAAWKKIVVLTLFILAPGAAQLGAAGASAQSAVARRLAQPEVHLLASWGFDDESLATREGHEAIQTENLRLMPSWSGSALLVDGEDRAFLRYPGFGPEGQRLIDIARGAVSFWFRPAWSTPEEAEGKLRPECRLLELALPTGTDRAAGWALGVTSDGSALYFASLAGGEADPLLKASNLVEGGGMVSGDAQLHSDELVALCESLGSRYRTGRGLRPAVPRGREGRPVCRRRLQRRAAGARGL